MLGLPFGVEQFLAVFARFNEAIWPAQLVAYALGASAVVLALRGGRRAAVAVPALLAGAWAFVGLAYHVAFFARVNPAAVGFGAAFVLQALLLVETAARRRLSFPRPRSLRWAVGLALIGYAAVGYPLLGAALGHRYPAVATFGVTPCPTTIFTWGLLLLAQGPVPRRLLVIPLLWSLVGLSAALQLGIREDLGLVLAGALALAFLARDVPVSPRVGALPGRAGG